MDPTETGDYTPPALNSPYRPSFSEICTYYINLYPPTQWWHYEYIAGFASSTDIEVRPQCCLGCLSSEPSPRLALSTSDTMGVIVEGCIHA